MIEVCINYEVVLLQHQTVNPLHIVSIAYCYTFKLGLPPPHVLLFSRSLFPLLIPTASPSVAIHWLRHGKIALVYIPSGRGIYNSWIIKKTMTKDLTKTTVEESNCIDYIISDKTALLSLNSLGKTWIRKKLTFVSNNGFIFTTMTHTPTHHTKVTTMVWSQMLLLSYHSILLKDLLRYCQRILKPVLTYFTLKVCRIQPSAIYGIIFQLLLISSNWGNISAPMNGKFLINTNSNKFYILLEYGLQD